MPPHRLCSRPAYLFLLFWALSLAGSAAATDPGEQIYRYYCYQCHGYAGNGRTLAASTLVPPPRDFTSATVAELPLDRMLQSILDGRPGTGMVSFASVLNPVEARAVAEYVQRSFMRDAPVGARYHSPENGWTDHERYASAFPFIEGTIGLDTRWEDLTPEERRGRRLYEQACVSCHDQPVNGVNDELVFELRAVSFPRRHFSHREDGSDLVSGASPYAVHDTAPDPAGLSESALAGRKLYEDNCAFCHAADGTGRNWIGSFLEPRPRDFTEPSFGLIHDSEALRQRILAGIPGTSMPAWRDVLGDEDIDRIVAYLQQAFAASE
jgi:cytochrome c oxidase cbb3-type subunit 3